MSVEKTPVKLTVNGILEDLKSGLTRDNIRSKYSLSSKDITALFKHPKLKGKKTIPALGFILEDDSTEEESQDKTSTTGELLKEGTFADATPETSSEGLENSSEKELDHSPFNEGEEGREVVAENITDSTWEEPTSDSNSIL